MKPFKPEQEGRTVGIGIQKCSRTVYADPLFSSLVDLNALQTIPAGEHCGRLFEGAHPHLLFRRDFTLRAESYALYAALPVKAEELHAPVQLEELARVSLSSLDRRLALVLGETKGDPPPLSSLSLGSYFSSICADICASLYAPLVIERQIKEEMISVRVHSTCLSQALGLALAAMLREGQSRLALRLSEEEGVYALSLIGERSITCTFVQDLLLALSESGGFLVRYTPFGVQFLLLPSHRPAAILRAKSGWDDMHLCEGFFLL